MTPIQSPVGPDAPVTPAQPSTWKCADAPGAPIATTPPRAPIELAEFAAGVNDDAIGAVGLVILSTAVEAEMLLMLTVSVLPSAVPVRIGGEANAGEKVMVKLVVDDPVQL